MISDLMLNGPLQNFQNSLLEHFASLKELESKAGATQEESLGEVRVLSVTNWPAHDLLLLVRDDVQMPLQSEISGLFGIFCFILEDANLTRLKLERLLCVLIYAINFYARQNLHLVQMYLIYM